MWLAEVKEQCNSTLNQRQVSHCQRLLCCLWALGATALPALFHVKVLALFLPYLRQLLETPLLPLGRETSKCSQLVPQGAWQRREGRGQFSQKSL